jgi:hypothetical protein
MRAVLMSLLGFVLTANGLFMLVDPVAWYVLVPGVPETGPLNPHFVRDIGCAYAVAGAALIGNAFEERIRAAAVAGALFLTLHALVAGREHSEHALAELTTIFAPAVIALWLVLSSNTRRTHNVQVADEAADRRV